MKTRTSQLLLGIAVIMVSCNTNTNTNRAETSEAVEVKKATGEEYDLVESESRISWRGTKPTGEHHGYVNLKSGSVVTENNIIKAGRFVFDMKSIVDEDLEDEEMNAKLTRHLKSEDFFYVEKYPEAVFELTSVEEYPGTLTESNETNMDYEVNGNLTIRGETKNIRFPAKIEMKDDVILISTPEFSLDRTLWNVNYQSKKVFAELKDKFIHDDMHIKLDLKLQKS